MIRGLKLMTMQRVGGMLVVFAVVMFISAGTVQWPAGWAFLVAFFGFVTALSLWLAEYNPDLLEERLTGVGKEDQKAWDKVFFVAAGALFLGWLALMALDAVRFRWSAMPLTLEVIGAILLLASFGLFFLTFRENSYLSPAVRLQRDRGQKVVATGPYRYVRHPMYAAFLIFMIGTTLWLGSWFGLVPGLILVAGTALRAVGEERMLRVQLDGYDAYMADVKYRLIPYVW